jgi:two-component system sensor histidine kinase CpxA
MSLFARIWLSYWLMMAATAAATLAITFVLAFQRAETLDRLSPAVLANAAQTAAERGEPGLRDWILQELHSNPELQIYFVDPVGRELTNRIIAGRPQSANADRFSVTTPAGHRYSMRIRRTRNFVFDAWNILLQPYTLIVLAILVSGTGSALLARFLTQPIARLREGVRSFAAGNLETNMPANLRARADELGALARDFDAMAKNLRTLISSREELLRDVSHELRSPLARLRVAASLARRGLEQDHQFDRIDCEIKRLDATLGQLLRFSRVASAPTAAFEELPLGMLVEECVGDAEVEAAMEQKSIGASFTEDLRVFGNREMLRSAIENVLRNAVRFAPQGSSIDVAVRRDASSAVVSVVDRGPGVAENDLRRIFEPFFRGVADSDGAGLGLSIAQRIMSIHGGTIIARNHAFGGLEVELSVPTR